MKEMHGGWGEYVIECQERAEVEKDRFFHKRIEISGNEFYCFENEFLCEENVEPEIAVTNVRLTV